MALHSSSSSSLLPGAANSISSSLLRSKKPKMMALRDIKGKHVTIGLILSYIFDWIVIM